ncbi:hypothetical protein GCM10022381_04010 [Leifsonia kafniensis]|uniref:Urea transporter n=1 Tax=Leifsonia kafniensis TaxID=475957 RepID=A0ABP7K1W5_9MICO
MSQTLSETKGVAAWGLALGHGLSQIFFQANVWTGALILAAFVVADWRMAVLVVLGSLASSATGLLFGSKMPAVRDGMQGFCGALVGAATFAAIGGQGAAYPIAIVGGALCAPVTWLVVWIFTHEPLKPFNLPSTTAPFCIVATGVLLATIPLHTSTPDTTVSDSAVTAFFVSLLTNVSQVVLVDSMWAGALILLGLFVASWKVGLAAVLGSAVGSLCALAMNESLQTTANGLAGYSGVLTAIALAAVFVKGTWEPWVLAIIGTAVTAVVTLLMHHLSGPTYTWPYILTTWVFLIIVYFVPRLKRA